MLMERGDRAAFAAQSAGRRQGPVFVTAGLPNVVPVEI
jgi:hypothetical protein